jgi:threonyl-tRNA synthetase
LRGNGIASLEFTNFRPLWLSPRQIIVIPVAHAYDQYASEVAKRFHTEGFYVEANLSSETLKKKILEAQVSQWNYILGLTLRCLVNSSCWASGARWSFCQCPYSR